MYVQVAGKVRVALSPQEPELQHTALYVTARGLTTGPIPSGDRTFEIDFDFVAHEVVIETNDGNVRKVPLTDRTVAAFYNAMLAALSELGIDVKLNPKPQEVPNPIPLDEDIVHASYDRDAVARFWKILSEVDAVLREFRAPFQGRHTPVEFFWGSFDLSYSRYSGRPATPPPHANLIMRKSMDAEEACTGFWFGDDKLGEPAFYAYMYPKPDGYENAPVQPAGALWNGQMGLFLLRYDDVRQSDNPRKLIRDFLESTYAAAKLPVQTRP